jgi:antitoxin component of MazEF toxin-antitoxin module
MSRATVRVRRVGGSIVARIPKELVDELGIDEGELVELEVRKVRRDWFGAFKELKGFSREEELDVHG